MKTPYILLWLEAPLQSWGHDSKFDRRDTLNFPTKSGILGLVCSAMGAGGEQRELLEKFAKLNMTVVAYVRTKQFNEKEPQKQPREPILQDFHMVGSGYNTQDDWEKLMIPKTMGGGKAVGGGTKMTYRFYLQDMAFAVALQVPDDIIQTVSNALKYPTWDLYLGRKNCVPTDFIYRGQDESEEEILKQAEQIAIGKKLMEDFRVLNGEHEGDEVITLNDVPIQFGTNKLYRDRRVTIVTVDGRGSDHIPK